MRIKYLDGLRGIAILLVLLFHAYSRWPAIVPYGADYADFPLFRYGWLGVQLFFLVSGFVIFMTLDKTKSFTDFMVKRWLRLFPAMLIASLLIYATASLFYERPAGMPQPLNLLPGLTFIEPDWWSKILGVKVSSLEGAFWSLYVEFKFYIIAGIVYFVLGRAALVPALIALYVGSLAMPALAAVSGYPLLLLAVKISAALTLEYFGWFAAGAMYYLHVQTQSEKWFIGGLLMSVLSALAMRSDYALTLVTLAALAVCALFAISLKSLLMQRLLQNKLLLFLGFVSYPLYLIHENAMISMIVKMPAYAGWLPQVLYPLPAIALLAFVAYLVAKYIEPQCRKWLNNHLRSVAAVSWRKAD